MTDPHATAPRWRKSSHSSGSGQCLEAAAHHDRRLARDSTRPTAGTQTHSSAAWTAFVRGVRTGRLTR